MPRRPPSDRVIGVALALGAFAYLLSYPPRLNGSDESLLLHGTKRLLAGQILYRDIFEFITPASFYYFAGAFVLGGPSLASARVAMAAANALSATLLYLLARKVAGVLEAILVVLVFVAQCIPTWNIASPHWLSTLLALATAVALLGPAGDRRRRAWLVGTLLGLAVCTQQQRAAFLGLWVVLATLILAWARGIPGWPREALDALLHTALGAAVVVVPMLGYHVWRASVHEVLAATVTFPFAGYGPAVVGRLGWGGAGFMHQGRVPAWFGWIPVAVPAILLAGSGRLLVHRRALREQTVAICLLLLAGLTAASVFYVPDFIHVAFIAPFSLAVAAGLLHAMRTGATHGPVALVRRTLWAGTATAVLVAAVLGGVEGWRAARALAPERYPTAFGTLAGTPLMRALVADLTEHMRNAPADRRSLFTYPSAPWLYLALPAENPTPFALLIQNYNLPAHFQRVTDILTHRPPDFVLLNTAFLAPDDPIRTLVEQRYERAATLFPSYELYRPGPASGTTP